MTEVMTSLKIPTCTKMVSGIRDNAFVIWVTFFQLERNCLWLWQILPSNNKNAK